MEATLQQFDALRSPGRTIRGHVDGCSTDDGQKCVVWKMRQCCKAIVNNSLIQRRGSPSGYGASIVDTYRHFGLYARRVLDGARPAGLPIEQPTKFKLVLNLKTAKAPRRRNCA